MEEEAKQETKKEEEGKNFDGDHLEEEGERLEEGDHLQEAKEQTETEEEIDLKKREEKEKGVRTRRSRFLGLEAPATSFNLRIHLKKDGEQIVKSFHFSSLWSSEKCVSLIRSQMPDSQSRQLHLTLPVPSPSPFLSPASPPRPASPSPSTPTPQGVNMLPLKNDVPLWRYQTGKISMNSLQVRGGDGARPEGILGLVGMQEIHQESGLKEIKARIVVARKEGTIHEAKEQVISALFGEEERENAGFYDLCLIIEDEEEENLKKEEDEEDTKKEEQQQEQNGRKEEGEEEESTPQQSTDISTEGNGEERGGEQILNFERKERILDEATLLGENKDIQEMSLVVLREIDLFEFVDNSPRSASARALTTSASGSLASKRLPPAELLSPNGSSSSSNIVHRSIFSRSLSPSPTGSSPNLTSSLEPLVSPSIDLRKESEGPRRGYLGRYIFSPQRLVADVIVSLVQELPKLPNRSNFGLFYLPSGSKSLQHFCLKDDRTLDSYELRKGAVLELRNRIPSSVPSSSSSPNSKYSKQAGGNELFMSLVVRHSPYQKNSFSRDLILPKSLFLPGEVILRQVVDVNRVNPRAPSGIEKGDLLITNAHVIFARIVFSNTSNFSLTNYDSFVRIPLLSVARIEKSVSGYDISLYCKTFFTHRFVLPRESASRNRICQYLEQLVYPAKFSDSFAFVMKKHFTSPDTGWDVFRGVDREMERRMQQQNHWRVSFVNAAYSFSETYPNKLIVPVAVSDEELMNIFSYRSKGRIPVLSYLHTNEATITRCSQPMAGISRSTCAQDELLLASIREANPHSDILYIFDARPRLNALGNQASGAGFEATGVGTGYENCKLDFLNIDNIHVMRKSYNQLQSIVEDKLNDSNWLSLLSNTEWLYHVRQVLVGAAKVAHVVDQKGCSTLLHCSDGWDRTAQLSALAQMMMNPSLRTLKGFMILVEKEWLMFGHRFEQRCGHGNPNFDDSQRAPIFLQFVDCVWQLTRQFPCSFEYNEHFLITVIDGCYSCHFGTFLLNCEFERKEAELRRRTTSLWTVIEGEKDKYSNPFYLPDSSPLYPSLDGDSLRLWRGFYLRSRTHQEKIITRDIRCLQLQQQNQHVSLSLTKAEKRVQELEREREEREEREKEREREIERLKKKIAELGGEV